MSEDWTVAKGSTGEIWASPGGVVIRRHGVKALLRYGNVAELRIPIEEVAAAQFKPAGIAPGWLRLAAHDESDPRFDTRSSSRDPYMMEFSPQQQPAFERLRRLIEQYIADSQRYVPITNHPDSTDVAAQIKRLVQLREQGMLSEDEFNQQKRQLMSGG
jgi:Short C-terminal domain